MRQWNLIDKHKLERNNHGFTLVELLIVIAIIAVLSSTVMVGVSTLRSADANGASSNLMTMMNSTRLNTMSVKGEWKMLIFNDEGTYYACVYHNDEVVEQKRLGSRLTLFYQTTGGIEKELTKGQQIIVTYVLSSGKVKEFKAGDQNNETQLNTDGVTSCAIITKGTRSEYSFKLWFTTGRTTSE